MLSCLQCHAEYKRPPGVTPFCSYTTGIPLLPYTPITLYPYYPNPYTLYPYYPDPITEKGPSSSRKYSRPHWSTWNAHKVSSVSNIFIILLFPCSVGNGIHYAVLWCDVI